MDKLTKQSKERPSKSQNPHSFRISKMHPKLLPSSPNAATLNKTHGGKYLFLDIPKTADMYATKSDYPDHRSARSSALSSQGDPIEKQVDDAAVKSLIQALMAKSPKFKEAINAEGEEITKWILASQSLRIKAQSIFLKLVDERRLGVDLRGLNASVIGQIQKGLMSTLTFQTNLYQKEKQFKQYMREVSDSLKQYKTDLINKIEVMSSN